MHVQCNSVEDFKRDITEQQKRKGYFSILQGTIRYDVSSVPTTDAGVCETVVVQLTAVIEFMSHQEKQQYLLDAVIDCGRSYLLAKRPKKDSGIDGRKQADFVLEEMAQFCNRHGLELLPGVITSV